MTASPLNSTPLKHAQLRALGKLRQQTRWPGYACIGDYHDGAYESEWVSPYTKSAHSVDADVMVHLIIQIQRLDMAAWLPAGKARGTSTVSQR